MQTCLLKSLPPKPFSLTNNQPTTNNKPKDLIMLVQQDYVTLNSDSDANIAKSTIEPIVESVIMLPDALSYGSHAMGVEAIVMVANDESCKNRGGPINERGRFLSLCIWIEWMVIGIFCR